jgi:hypothetical protein
MTQIAIPIEVAPHEVQRKVTLGGAIELCAEVGGKEPKAILADLKLDKAQWSRWISGHEGVCWPKLSAVMDLCGNDAPLQWMVNDRATTCTACAASNRKQSARTACCVRKTRRCVGC